MVLARRNHPNPVREQWRRTTRWHERLQAANPRDAEDFGLVVLHQCWTMHDWLIKSLHETTERSRVENRYSQHDVEQLFQSSELRFCRDLANGAKHLDLRGEVEDDPRMHPLHAVVAREFDWSGDRPTTRATAFSDTATYDLRELCDACVDQLRAFLRQYTLIADT